MAQPTTQREDTVAICDDDRRSGRTGGDAHVTTASHSDGMSSGARSHALLQVRINARLPSVQRGDRYEDPLAYWLESTFPGSRVTGGGTLRSPEGEPLSCGIDAEVVGDADQVVHDVVGFLEELGAPRGSSASIVDGAYRPFGSSEGLAVYLNGTDLPAAVYAAHDVNEFFDRLHEAIQGTGALQAFWEGQATTAVYAYGPSYDAMHDAIAPLLASHPLAEKARVLQIA
jgi:hypothetical protein